MDETQELSVEEARAKLGDLVKAAELAGQETVITYHGRPAARIVPAQEHVLFYRDRDRSPAWQPVSPRHAGDPGVTTRTAAENMTPEQQEEMTLAAEQGARQRARAAGKRNRQRYGRMPQPKRSAGPQPHFMFEGRGIGVITWFRDVDGDGNDKWVVHARRVREELDPDSNDWVQRDLGPVQLSEPRHPLFATEDEARTYRRDLLASAPEASEALFRQLIAAGSGARLILTPDRRLVITTDPGAPGATLDDAESAAGRVPAHMTAAEAVAELGRSITEAL
jgi:prevent-host-death family protein